MIRVGIVLGSTRPGRLGEAVARWVLANAPKRPDASFELVDVARFGLPLLDEPIPASAGKYQKPHTQAWAETIRRLDAFVFVTPEYSHGLPGALKNALDFLYAEWNDKAAAFVSYGSAGGVRAVEQLRQVMGELQVADVRAQVHLSIFTDFEEFTTFRPDPKKAAGLAPMFDQLLAWGGALQRVRTG